MEANEIEANDSLFHLPGIHHKFDILQHRQISWQLSNRGLLLCSVLLLLLAFQARRLFSYTPVRWYHAASTVDSKLKSRSGKPLELSELCKSVTPPCFLNPFMRNRHLQTLFFTLDQRTYPLYFRRMIFESHNPDYEGTFAVDFTTSPFEANNSGLPARTAYYSDDERRQVGSDDSRPMLVILHGLCGGSHELYLQHVVAPLVASKQKWEACVLISRGCGQSHITGGGMYYAHATSDIRQTTEWLRTTFPNRPLYALGFSMGANILTRYIAEEGESCVYKAAVAISNPWNLELAALHLQHTLLGRWLYSPAMTANLMDVFSHNVEKIKTINGEPLSKDPASQVRLMHEYDRYIQCPTWGFPTERVYYRKASSCDSVLDVKIPFWAINAEDDPIAGSETIPKAEFAVSPYTVMCTTEGGGHLGWFQLDGNRWYARPVVNFLQKLHGVQ